MKSLQSEGTSMGIAKYILVALLLINQANAEDVYSDQFQTIQTTEFYEVVTDEETGEEIEVLISNTKAPSFIETLAKKPRAIKLGEGNILMMTKQLIALGKEIYKIVEAGKPVTTVTSQPIEILPKDDKGGYIPAMQLHDWKAPVVKKYSVKTKNYLGISPISFDFMLIFSYGGQDNGKGKYITGAEVRPTNIDIKWGYNFDAEFKVQNIMNQGSSDSPVASAVLMLEYKISTVLQTHIGNKTFFVNGLGQALSY